MGLGVLKSRRIFGVSMMNPFWLLFMAFFFFFWSGGVCESLFQAYQWKEREREKQR